MVGYEDKHFQKQYYVIMGVAIGIPSAILGFSLLFDAVEKVITYMATLGLISTGIISGYIAYRIIEHKRKEREQYIEIWRYHDEYPRVTPERISRQFGIPRYKAQLTLEEIKTRKDNGERVVCIDDWQFIKPKEGGEGEKCQK